jgi:hypothetical protein
MRNWLLWCNMIYTLIYQEMDIQSSFSFKFWVQYWSMEIKGENVRVDLMWAWPQGAKSTSHALIGGNPLNQWAVGLITTPIKGHTNQNSLPKRKTPKTWGPDPLRRATAGCTTAGHHHAFLLDAGVASGSCLISSPTVCMTEPPQKWGVCFPRSYWGILDKVRMHKHTQLSIQYHTWNSS